MLCETVICENQLISYASQCLVSIICTHRVNNSLTIGRYSQIRMAKSCFYYCLTNVYSHLCTLRKFSLPFSLSLSRSTFVSMPLSLSHSIEATHKLDVCDHYGICIKFFHFVPVSIFLPPPNIILFFFRLLFRDRTNRWEKRETQIKNSQLKRSHTGKPFN